jgi:hypothetical protein
MCARARGVADSDLTGKNAVMATPTDAIRMTVAADRVLQF